MAMAFVPEQYMIAVLFLSNFIFFVFFQCMQRFDFDETTQASSLTNDEDGGDLELMIPKDKKSEIESSTSVVTAASTDSKAVVPHGGKKLSAPFTGTVDCFTNLTSECFRLSLIMALTYVCEKHWYAPHSGKSYSRDLFLFILLCFFAYAYYTIKPIKDLSLLGREQTEEWKGWMQFIFLLYHYFHAEEVYNSVRVMITCYVWMTGFGNFSFFYIKKDFGWLRLVQMLWRLNFTVLLLMWTHNNTWILYYICPMHTFYFLMVYAAMAVLNQYNHTKWAIRGKIFALGIIIYIVWDVNPNNLFDFLFAWLGTEKVIGANSGSVWEYYFRTSLDHWSSYLGMIFALNFPLCEQYFVLARNTANGLPLIIAAILFAAATIY
jgi:N-acetylneuraminate 9-O-acetyltransferase